MMMTMMMMMKKIMVLSLIMLLISSSHMEGVESSVFDCDDACSTGCAGKDSRLVQRCDRKCQIKCGPDLEVEGHQS